MFPFRHHTFSSADFGTLDRSLYRTERKRSYTITSSEEVFEKPVLERVRNFTKTRRGIKNHGDLLRVPSSISSTSSFSDDQGRWTSLLSTMSYTSDDCFKEKESNEEYIIKLIGIPGVGKSSLLQQMRTSEFLEKCPPGPDSTYISVPVLLGGKQSVLNFLEADMYTQNHGSNRHYDSFLMVYSVTDRRSYNFLANRLKEIRKEIGDKKTIHVVANKTDLIKFREVSISDGKTLARQYNCNYVEVSVSLRWNIDKLLVELTEQLNASSGHERKRSRNLGEESNEKVDVTSHPHPGPERKSFKKRTECIFSRLRKLFKRKHSKA